jgi:hypothetical protein
VFPAGGNPERGEPTRGRELHEVLRDGKSGCPRLEPSRRSRKGNGRNNGEWRRRPNKKKGRRGGRHPEVLAATT